MAEIAFSKSCYYNRTWERYEYETVLRGLLSKSRGRISNYALKVFLKKITNEFRENDPAMNHLKMVGVVAALGEVFGQTEQDKNDWKARMIKAGLENQGLIMPDNWGTLSEYDKKVRLDTVINLLNK